MLEAAATSSHNITQTLTKTAATKLYTMRAKVKGINGRGWAAMYAGNNAFNDVVKAFFNTGSPAVGTLTNGATTFKLYGWMAYDLGNGWVQIEMEFITDTDTSLKPLFLIASADNTASYLGDVTKGFYIYDEWVYERPI